MVKKSQTMEVFTNINIPLLNNEDTIYAHVIIGKKELSYDYYVINHPVNKDYIDYYAHLDNKVLHESIIHIDDSYHGKDFTMVEKTFAQSISDNYDCVISAYVGIPKDYDLAIKIKNNVGYPFVSSLMGIDDYLSDEDKVRKIVDRDFNFRNSLEIHMINRCVDIGDFNYENKNGDFFIFRYLDLPFLNNNDYRFPYGKEIFTNDNIQEFQLNLLWYIILYHLMQSENENTTVKELLSEKETLDSIIDSFNNTSLSDSDNDYCAFLSYMVVSQNNPLNINYYNTIEKRNLLLGLSKNDLIQLFNKSSLVSPDFDSYYDVQDDYIQCCKVFKDDSVVRLNNTLSYWFEQLRGEGEVPNSIDYGNIMGVVNRAYIRNISNIYSQLSDKPDFLNDNDLNDILNVGPLNSLLDVKKVGEQSLKIIAQILNIFGKDYIENSIKLSHLYTLIQLGKDKSLFPNINSFGLVDLIKKFNIDKYNDDNLLEFLCNVYVNFKTIRLSDGFFDSDNDISVYNDINPEMFFNIYNFSYKYRTMHHKGLNFGYMPYHIDKINKIGF